MSGMEKEINREGETGGGDPLTMRERVCYALSALGGNLPNYLVVGYLTLFATDVMGVSASKIGLVVMLCSICDAFTDVFITNFTDRTKTRWGTYRPWLLFTSPLIAVNLILLFFYPSFLVTERQKIFWLSALYFLLSPILLTAYLCPEYIMLSVISPREHDRIRLGSARSIGETLSDLIINSLCLTLVILFGGSHRSLAGWRAATLVFAALSLACGLAGFAGTTERVRITNEDNEGNTLSLRRKLGTMAKVRSYRLMLALNVAILIPTIESVLISYFVIYVLGHDTWVSLLAAVTSVSSICASLSLPRLGKKLGLHRLIDVSCICLIAAAVILLFANNLPSALIFSVFKGVGYGYSISVSGILWTQTADHVQEVSGIAIPGVVMATGSFAAKIVMGVCMYAGTGILALGGYQAEKTVQAVRTRLFMRGGMIAALLLGAGLAFLFNHMLAKEFRAEQTDKAEQ